MVVGKTLYQTKAYKDFQDSAKIIRQNRLKRSFRILLLICPVTYSGSILWYSRLFFIHFVVEYLPIVSIGKGSYCFYVSLLRNWYKRIKYENRIQTSVDNTVNDLQYEIKVENRVKDKNNFFIKRNIAFLFFWKNIFYSRRHIFFKISKNLIASVKHKYAWQKPRMPHR